MYGQEETLREQIVNEYREDLDKLLSYLPYLDKKTGKDVQGTYTQDGKLQSIAVPTYDSTLLAFVKLARSSKFMYRNYPYVYTRNRIQNHDDERRLLEKAQIRDIDIFRGILSKYIMEGQTKAYRWTEGVEERIYVSVLDNLQKRFAEYDAQLAKKGLNS